LSLDRAEYHRPALKRGTTDQVWNAWGNHCSHLRAERITARNSRYR
jgi:hypothetical protein